MGGAGRRELSGPRWEPVTAGRRVGTYELLELLGSGGMGAVYRARRTDRDFESEVAVKLLQPGHIGSEVSRRFARERQILAELSHPGIAHLVDGGTSDDGTPYLVMELVDGRPIDAYCRAQELHVQQRLDLFLDVCTAVRHAHARLVVHTDLKPTNVLVDDEGHIHLLDFGIAKIMDDPEAEGSTTWTLPRPLTPAYASPEQVRGEPIATSTDVYSLGVLLYRLLTGELPYPGEADGGRALEEAILSHDPAPPSAVSARPADGKWVPTGAIDDDLDTIVLKALHKDPERRYASVERLADDIERYRAGLPIRARPDTLGYRTGKFVRRHRATVAGTAVTAGALLAFGIASTVLGLRLGREREAAARAAEEAEAVTDFLVDVFDATDPNRARGRTLTAREILGSGGARLRSELTDQPAVQGAVASAIGEAYLRLAAYDSAVSHLAYARERIREAHGVDSHEYASSLDRLGWAMETAGDLDEAEALFGEALDCFLALTGPESPEVARSLVKVAGIQAQRGDYEGAEASYLEALAIQRARLPADDELSLATSLNNLAGALEEAGRYAEAEPLYHESLETRTRLPWGEVLAPLRECEAIIARELGPDHVHLALPRQALGDAYAGQGRSEEAERWYRAALRVREAGLPPNHPDVAFSKSKLGGFLLDEGRVDEAAPLLEEAKRVRDAALEPDHPHRIDSLVKVGRLRIAQGRVDEGLALIDEAAQTAEAARGADDRQAQAARDLLARSRSRESGARP